MEKILNFVSLDFEYLTKEQYTVCAIGFVIVKNSVIVEEHYSLVYPGEIKGEIIPASGITPEMCIDAPCFSEAWEFAKLKIGGMPIVIHNKSTEPHVLKKACAFWMGRENESDNYTFIDTKEMAGGMGLSDCCEKYGIPLNVHHNALEDARACACLFMKLCNEEMIVPKPVEMKKKKDAVKPSKEGTDTNCLSDEEVHTEYANDIFVGKVIQITGEFDEIGNRETVMPRILKRMGAKKIFVGGSGVRKTADILLAGDGAGWSKREEAEELGKTIIEEYELYEILRDAGEM